MTIEISKLNYGIVTGPAPGLSITELNMGVVINPAPGIAITKINYGVVIDTGIFSAGRRRSLIGG